jgi:hypothetical protein
MKSKSHHRNSGLLRERPIFSDKQVLALEDIEVGREYYLHWATGHVDRMTVLSEPYWAGETYRFQRIDIVINGTHYRGEDWYTTITLADHNVVPYEGDTCQHWNRSNYLEWAD